jgi:hypothetical protein
MAAKDFWSGSVFSASAIGLIADILSSACFYLPHTVAGD